MVDFFFSASRNAAHTAFRQGVSYACSGERQEAKTRQNAEGRMVERWSGGVME
jgi:hypothetical protein